MAAEVDAFSLQLLDESKRFLEKASEGSADDAYLHAALVLCISAVESHMNGVAEELAIRSGATILDLAILSERDLRMNQGEWALTDTKFYRLEDRLAYIFQRYGRDDVRQRSWWSVFCEALKARNALVHPRDVVTLTVEEVGRYISCIVEVLNDLYLAVFGRPHPSHGRGLHSTLTF